MGLKYIQIENSVGYAINWKKAKRKSHKQYKAARNRKMRRKINSDLDFQPNLNEYHSTEF